MARIGQKLTSTSKQVARKREERRMGLMAYKGNACEKCGWEVWTDLHPDCFDFHHRSRRSKKFTLGRMNLTLSMKQLKAEVRKCDLLCSNCHREVEAKRGRKI